MHSYFNNDAKHEYHEDYYSHLLAHHADALHRDCAMVYLSIDENILKHLHGAALRDSLYEFITNTYNRLANHCYLAIRISPFKEGSEDGQWRLFSDLVLFAEKHREVKLDTGYFRSKEVASITHENIPNLSLDKAQFEIANEGFFYRDCFILSPQAIKERQNKVTTSKPGDLLLLFEKNERDEREIPCPACRSNNVRGNSYPSLGVKSWECQNPICPDRSAYDRGNRYSLSSIIKQEAIKSEEDQIPEWSLKRWKLDVTFGLAHDDITDMLVRHFTLHGDSIVFVNNNDNKNSLHGRRIIHESFDLRLVETNLYEKFQRSPFFNRFAVKKDISPNKQIIEIKSKSSDTILYNGDCFDVLYSLEPNYIDGAITSPPYYNARSYTTWPNMYCYLYDMYNSSRAVFHSLKPGGIYVFNIFDYFDNENIVAFSAMGRKRMILGAYIVNLFRRAGFELVGNTAWYKGEIEGKRNFNQGNRSPYYQFPFNCWEHCFIFRKPSEKANQYDFPTILDAKPVFKMVKGTNVLGHTAPYPVAIPELLISQMRKGERVLDPYSGSMTTGRMAYQKGLKSISIELHKEYCDLGLKLLNEQNHDEVNMFKDDNTIVHFRKPLSK
jgi:DNA modification methylase